MECTTTTAGVEVAPNAEEVEPMDEGVAPAAERVVETESEEEEGPMRGDEGATSGDAQPAGQAGAAIAGNPTGATYVVKFDANCNKTSNLVQGPERAALRPFRDSSTAVKQLLGLKQGADGADPAETIQLVAHAKLTDKVFVNRSAVHALAVVGTRAEDAQLKIAIAAIAGKKAADKKVATKARATKALEAANTKLRELVAVLEGKEPDDNQKAGIEAAKAKVAACALKLQSI